MKIQLTVFFTFILFSYLSFADSITGQSSFNLNSLQYQVGIRYGSPSSKQILPINTKEMYLQAFSHRIDNSIATTSFELSVSQLNIAEEKGYVYGIGPLLEIPVDGLKGSYVNFRAKVHWLTRSDYGRKNYGGPLHWTYAVGYSQKLTGNTSLSYFWQHMSNGDVYKLNPGLETHTIDLGIKF